MMTDDYLFSVSDPRNEYRAERIGELLQMAADQGHPVAKGSYLQYMTVVQLDRLVHGKYDA